MMDETGPAASTVSAEGTANLPDVLILPRKVINHIGVRVGEMVRITYLLDGSVRLSKPPGEEKQP